MALSDNKRIVIPFLPTLLHLASVKVCILLYDDFDGETLQHAIFRISNGIPLGNYEIKKDPRFTEVNSAHKKLLSIPTHLREAVFEAVQGMESQVNTWRSFDVNVEGCTFYWRSDGRINRNKTAQQLLLNTNIGIKERFALACRFCLQESIQHLWSEMEVSGETENLDYSIDARMSFWVRWIRGGSLVPWRQAALEYMNNNPSESRLFERFSDIFSSLRPDARKKFLRTLGFLKNDECMLCLCALTREEEDLMLTNNGGALLISYCNWPYRSLFLEVAGKMLNYINADGILALRNWFRLERRKERRTCKWFARFYYKSNVEVKESVNKFPYFTESIESWIEKIRKKRKADFYEQINKKRLIVE